MLSQEMKGNSMKRVISWEILEVPDPTCYVFEGHH